MIVMNALSPLTLVVVLSSVALPHTGPDTVDAVGRWLHARTLQAASSEPVPAAGCVPAPGVLKMVALAELDAPEAVKEQLRRQIERSRAGPVRVPDGTIPSPAGLFASLPKTKRSDAVLRQRLPSPPTNLLGTVLGVAEVIGMEPSGALEGVKSTGLTRFYRLSDVGIVAFNEENFRAPGTLIEVIAEAQNTAVNGSPAQLEMNVDGQGRGSVVLSWAAGDKAYTLTATGDSDVERKARVLQDIAAAIND
jgi:hypothetical protein